MENQHRKISGYRELSQDEIDAMNAIKALGPKIEEVVNNMPDTADARWKAIGVTDLQKGLMSLTRAIAKPEFF
jgi:hypothetical protein